MLISLCMIVRDEEAVLARCLDSVKGLADEIVIVDTGSADGTAELARRYTDNVFFFPWQDDFSLARNEAFSHASGEYLLWLDADDVVERTDFSALRAFLEREMPDMVACFYLSGDLVYERERFLRRDKNYRFAGRVHEAIPPRGRVVHYPLSVRHMGRAKKNGRRNLDIYLKWAEEEPLSPRDLFYFGRELFYHNLFTQAEAVLSEMLKGDGWYVNKIAACDILSRCREARGDREGALCALLKSLVYGEPRAFICCRIGAILKEQGAYAAAAFWYTSALSCRDHTAEGDFEEPACRSITPLLELVVCHWRLGDREKAREYHKRAEAVAPAHPSVLYNRRFFEPFPKDPSEEIT